MLHLQYGLLIFLLACPVCLSFIWADSTRQHTHTTITRTGAYDATAEYVRQTQKYNLKCVTNSKSYQQAVQEIIDGNAWTDRSEIMYWQAWVHFDSELFNDTVAHIRNLRDEAVSHISKRDYSPARTKIGHILHAIQDFYSHSNWIEMGKTEPSPGTLATSPTPNFGVPLAKPDEVTCYPCKTPFNCQGNVITHALTTAFYSKEKDRSGVETSKRGIKCSHGGGADGGSKIAPIGGIDKDHPGEYSPHGYNHNKAAMVAIKDTRKHLLYLHRLTGDAPFANFMGIDPACAAAANQAASVVKQALNSKWAGKGQRPNQWQNRNGREVQDTEALSRRHRARGWRYILGEE